MAALPWRRDDAARTGRAAWKATERIETALKPNTRPAGESPIRTGVANAPPTKRAQRQYPAPGRQVDKTPNAKKPGRRVQRRVKPTLPTGAKQPHELVQPFLRRQRGGGFGPSVRRNVLGIGPGLDQLPRQAHVFLCDGDH